jgi:hypothetical protein
MKGYKKVSDNSTATCMLLTPKKKEKRKKESELQS